MTAHPAASSTLRGGTDAAPEPLVLAKQLAEADAPPVALLSLLHRINQARAARRSAT